MNISTIVANLYKTYATKLAQANIRLDIDVPNPAVKVEKPARILKITTAYLDYCLKHPQKSNLILRVSRGNFQIIDEPRLLKTSEKAIFDALATTTHTHFTIKSRLGFGTTLTIPLAHE